MTDQICDNCGTVMKVISRFRRLPKYDELGDDLTEGQEADYHAAALSGDYGDWGIDCTAYQCPKCQKVVVIEI
ncbi:MAG: hypothetical protein PWR21_584 [Methanoculleus sp.]|nr:hypothetical protein [Methanoculleus sp.]MDK2989142.1 hypothetical protein [Methanoculleus sp.]